MNIVSNNIQKILVVEDEPSICQICLRVLTDEGFEVDIAENGRIAQDMITEKQYNMCFIDIRTPEINGKELYKWLQERQPELEKMVAFTTGDIIDSDTKDFLEKTGRHFLAKPYTPNDLKALIQKVLKNR